jgi:hypothetical protein
MAVWRPQDLSTKLCKLFDAGYCDVKTFARQCEEPYQLIEAVTNRPGMRISRGLQMRIGKVLSGYMRLHPDLYHDPGPLERSSKRGVEEVELRSRDWRGFEITDSTGACILYVEIPRKKAKQENVDKLWQYLEEEDPQPQLKVMG